MRKLKREILALLAGDDEKAALDTILAMEPRKVINPLFTGIQQTDPKIRDRAVRAMGRVVAGLAETSMEQARIIMRRLMWSLNDESGGIGWGAPDAMAHIMALSQPLAEEYHRILVSYVDPDGNYLEYAPLREGAIQGLKLLAKNRPQLMAPYQDLIASL